MAEYNDFNNQLHQDVHQIQLIASAHPTEAEQIDRIQHIAMAAAYCLSHRMGPLAAGHWLEVLSERIERQGSDDVH